MGFLTVVMRKSPVAVFASVAVGTLLCIASTSVRSQIEHRTQEMRGDAETCRSMSYQGSYFESFCSGYLGKANCVTANDFDLCTEGESLRRSEASDANAQNDRNELETIRREVEKMPPIPAASNPLLGVWKLESNSAGILGLLNPCVVTFGEAPFELTSTSMVQDGAAIESLRYRQGKNGVHFVLGERVLRLLAFEIKGNDRISNGDCSFRRVRPQRQ